MPKQDGAVIRNSDGSLYFIRQEILDACRVAADEVADTERMLDEHEGEVAGFELSTGPIASVTPVSFNNPSLVRLGAVQGQTVQDLANIGKNAASTVMCCW
jgi:hypothetical protein